MGKQKVFDQESMGRSSSLNEKLGEPVKITTSESRSRLAQHMSVLQAYGYSDISTLGELRISSDGLLGKALLQKSGILFPISISHSNKVITEASSDLKIQIENKAKIFSGQSVEIEVKTTGTFSEDPEVNLRNVIPLNSAYWFGTQIIIQDDTMILLDQNVKSLVIIADTLSIGQRVTISWARPQDGSTPIVPLKPRTPDDWPQATTIGTISGHDGSNGMNGGQGSHGQPAPELEMWFLQSTGFPSIDLRGQDGFVGGRGGDGGDGGRGQKGCNTEKKNGFCSQEQGAGGNGGNGGRAGDGGRGGNGGTGGKFSVFSTSSVISTWLQSGLTISIDGGNEGSGGDAGRPGEGGPGGDKGDKIHAVCSDNNRTPGVKGNTGASGVRGPNGSKGELISNSIQYSIITSSDFFIELAKPAITSVYPQAAFVGDRVSVNGLRFANGDQVVLEGYDGTINIPCATSYVSQALLTFEVPRVPGGYAMLEVVQTDGTHSSSKGTLLIRPRVESIIPAGKLVPGEFYFIHGTGLGRQGNIWINNEDIGTFKSIDNVTIKFKARRPSNAEVNPTGENVLLKVINAEGIGAMNFNQSDEIKCLLDTYRMLVFGDSVMWGGGLPEHLKFYSLAAKHVTAKMENVSVHSTIKAHHGAKIGRGDNTNKSEMHGEISSRYPTILQQIDSLSSMADAASIDLILVDGGANDLPITKVMLESDSNKLEELKLDLKNRIRQYCFTDMTFMLQKFISQFPNAKIIVTGYYHIVSEASDQNFIQKMVLTIYEDLTSFPLWGNTMANTQAKAIALSNVWVKESNENLAEAVRSINDTISGDPRVFFVNPETDPSHAAHAPNSLLWEPGSLGEPSDPMWKGGRQQLRDANEQRIRDEGGAEQYYIVKGNSSYHPNPAGAERFLEKMKPALDSDLKITRIALRASNGKYVCAEGGGNNTLVADRLVIGPWETFEMVDLGSNQIALKSINGLYVCAEYGGGSSVTVNRFRIGQWETFTLVPQTIGFALKTSTGSYLTISPGSGINSMNATSSQIQSGEIFQIL